MSVYDSDFEFELEDECDDCDGLQKQHAGNEAMLLENAFYEAEDLMTRQPDLALRNFKELLETIDSESDDETLSIIRLNWRIKIFKSMLSLPCDLESRTGMLKQSLSDLHTTNSTESLSSLILACLDGIAASAPIEIAIEMHGLARDEMLKAELSRASRQVSLKEARLLLDVSDGKRLEELLQGIYWRWVRLHMTEHSAHLTTALLQTFSTVSHSELADIFEFFAIDVQRKVHETAESLDRVQRLLTQCRRLNRVLIDKKASIILHSAYGQSLCQSGHFDGAYAAFYAAWDATYSLGSMDEAKTLLLNLTACNILSKSKIDPLSSREARALLNSEEVSEFQKTTEWLAMVAGAASALDCRLLKNLFNEMDFLRIGVFEGSDAEEDLLYSVRCDKVRQAGERSAEELMKDLAMETEGEVCLFLSHGSHGLRQESDDKSVTVEKCLKLVERVLQLLRAETTSLLSSHWTRTEQTLI